ncbi:MAG: extracellular solute-binding protein [Candidatus Andersenbacteria bacterium]|nr:extracellular solute-binding protein [Candidatus Andersenbacteria bacterium]MBI3250671.1 extracellular solute-binding protein [Candidatus Andersenbacteria bacterium]
MNTSFRTKLPLLALVVISILALTGFGCRTPTGVGDKGITGDPLVVWGLWQESAWIDPLLEQFKAQTGIAVEYKNMGNVASYEQELLTALAEGRGPDVFVIHHTWVESKRGIMSPAPPEIITLRQAQEEFVPVVLDDLIRDNFVYALPTSVDTLALYYNQDLLAAAGIANAPRTWTDFQRAVEKLTKVSRLGIIQDGGSGAAMGTASNINRASDVLQMLMMQQGLSILKEDGRSDITEGEIGEKALIFYYDFANKSKKVYTWDSSQTYSIDAFSEGKTAMMINYSYHIPTIRAKNSRLRFGIAPVPQIPDNSKPVTFASYWPFAVSISSRSPDLSWQLIRFLTGASASQVINEAQVAPPARRDTIPLVQSDPTLGVFADQALIAASWPRSDIVATDAIFNTMIENVVKGIQSIPDALEEAKDKLERISKEEL